MSKETISRLEARQLIDCKCRPMIEVDVITEGGAVGRGSAPTGSSVGMYESFVMRDGNPKEYNGMSVHKAVDIVKNVIGPKLIGMDVMDQRALDMRMLELDGTQDKSRIGGNSIYSTSIACIRAAAACRGLPLYRHLARGEIKTLPIPTFNVINGGTYGGKTLAFNEFILVPYRADNIEQAVELGVKCFQKLGQVIARFQNGRPAAVGGSFGYAAPSEDPEEVLELMREALRECECEDKVTYALDCAASEMYDAESGTYLLKGKRVTSDEQIDYVSKLSRKFNFMYVEDLLDENDWDGFSKAVKALPHTNIIGDDLIATNIKRLKKAYDSNAVNGFILKPNQVGTITEALDTYDFAREHNLLAIPSGRSGGVVGDVVMDFAVGLQVGIIKNGAPRSGERIEKLNFLLRVNSEQPHCRLFDGKRLAKF